jgi:hypothetical protein
MARSKVGDTVWFNNGTRTRTEGKVIKVFDNGDGLPNWEGQTHYVIEYQVPGIDLDLEIRHEHQTFISQTEPTFWWTKKTAKPRDRSLFIEQRKLFGK